MDRLSPVELAVVRGLADGLTLKEVAERGGWSPRYVRNVSASLQARVGASTLTALVMEAIAAGVITVERPT